MTNLEALQSAIGGNYPFDDNVYLKPLTDNGLTSTDTYSIDNIKAIDFATMQLILTVILRPDVEEGGYKVSDSNKLALISVRNSLLNKYGLPLDTIAQPKLKGVRVW